LSDPEQVNTERSSRTVFISYSRSDSVFVNHLAKWLRESGCNVWQDTAALRGGQDWTSEIDQAIRASDVILVVLSPSSSASEWVTKETLLALNLDKPVVPILFRDTKIPVQLVDIQFIDFRDERNEAAQSLLAAITNVAHQPGVLYKPLGTGRYRKVLAFSILGVAFSILGVVIIAVTIYVAVNQITRNSRTSAASDTQPEKAVTPNTNTATPNANTSPNQIVTNKETPWPTKEGAYTADSSETIPQFPAKLSGYKSEDGKDFWGNKFATSDSIRLVQGKRWEVIPDFPLTMNHCGEGMFMMRWRSAVQDVEIKSTLGDSTQGPSATKLSNFGYMFGNNCDQPMFMYSSAKKGDEVTLVDVYYELKFWQAAP
jgi:hypothetical protein